MTVNDHWSARIDAANKYYQEWSNLYKCEMLERYYRGFQWRQNVDINVYKPYTLNLVFATIKIKLAALDSFFRFGIVETGYAADWQNPKKKDFIVNDENDTVEDSLEVPIDERLYWKRIRASR